MTHNITNLQNANRYTVESLLSLRDAILITVPCNSNFPDQWTPKNYLLEIQLFNNKNWIWNHSWTKACTITCHNVTAHPGSVLAEKYIIIKILLKIKFLYIENKWDLYIQNPSTPLNWLYSINLHKLGISNALWLCSAYFIHSILDVNGCECYICSPYRGVVVLYLWLDKWYDRACLCPALRPQLHGRSARCPPWNTARERRAVSPHASE